jgi:hypothetical protein
MKMTISTNQILNLSMLAYVASCPKLHDALVDLALIQELGITNFTGSLDQKRTRTAHRRRVQRQNHGNSAQQKEGLSATEIQSEREKQNLVRLYAWLAKSVQDIEAHVCQEHLLHLRSALVVVSTAARQEVAPVYFATEDKSSC